MPYDKKKSSPASLTVDSYGQAGPLEAEPPPFYHESLRSLAAKLQSGLSPWSHYSRPPNIDQELTEGGRYPAAIGQGETFKGYWTYISVALLTAAISCGVVLFLLRTYSGDSRVTALRAPPAEGQTGSGSPADRNAPVLRGQPADRNTEDPAQFGRNVQAPALASSANPVPAMFPPLMTDTRPVTTNENQDSLREWASRRDSLYPRTSPPRISGAVTEGNRPEHQSAAAPARKPAQAVRMETALEKGGKNQILKEENKSAAKLPTDEEAKMLKRASDLMDQADVASARLIYKYLGEHGSSTGESLFERTGTLGDQGGVPR
jgi:hypothetical protein